MYFKKPSEKWNFMKLYEYTVFEICNVNQTSYSTEARRFEFSVFLRLQFVCCCVFFYFETTCIRLTTFYKSFQQTYLCKIQFFEIAVREKL